MSQTGTQYPPHPGSRNTRTKPPAGCGGVPRPRAHCLALAGAVVLALLGSPAAAYDLSQHRWQQRLLFLVAPRDDDPGMALQRDAVARRSDALLDRDLLVFQLFAREGLVAERALSAHDVQALRAALDLGPDDRSLILIGKDGGIKRRAPLDTDLGEIFRQIDAMPMRRSEMRAKERAGVVVTEP
jgi:hypothetical protein